MGYKSIKRNLKNKKSKKLKYKGGFNQSNLNNALAYAATLGRQITIEIRPKPGHRYAGSISFTYTEGNAIPKVRTDYANAKWRPPGRQHDINSKNFDVIVHAPNGDEYLYNEDNGCDGGAAVRNTTRDTIRALAATHGIDDPALTGFTDDAAREFDIDPSRGDDPSNIDLLLAFGSRRAAEFFNLCRFTWGVGCFVAKQGLETAGVLGSHGLAAAGLIGRSGLELGQDALRYGRDTAGVLGRHGLAAAGQGLETAGVLGRSGLELGLRVNRYGRDTAGVLGRHGLEGARELGRLGLDNAGVMGQGSLEGAQRVFVRGRQLVARNLTEMNYFFSDRMRMLINQLMRVLSSDELAQLVATINACNYELVCNFVESEDNDKDKPDTPEPPNNLPVDPVDPDRDEARAVEESLRFQVQEAAMLRALDESRLLHIQEQAEADKLRRAEVDSLEWGHLEESAVDPVDPDSPTRVHTTPTLPLWTTWEQYLSDMLEDENPNLILEVIHMLLNNIPDNTSTNWDQFDENRESIEYLRMYYNDQALRDRMTLGEWLEKNGLNLSDILPKPPKVSRVPGGGRKTRIKKRKKTHKK